VHRCLRAKRGRVQTSYWAGRVYQPIASQVQMH
jgi:hypothetical protein